MSHELTALTLAGLLQVSQYVAMSIPANIELGIGKTISPRDPVHLVKPLIDQMSPKTGRLYRALNNHFEGLVLFTLAVFVITLSEKSNIVTVSASYIYLCARVLYVPAYYFGLKPWRTLIWLFGFFATTTILITALI